VFIEQTNEHTHPPDQVQCEVANVKSGIKRQAQTTVQQSQHILAEEMARISERAAVNLPSIDNIRRNIRSVRQNKDVLPIPINILDILVMPQEFQITVNGEQFLLFDSGVGDMYRILIFGSPQGTTSV